MNPIDRLLLLFVAFGLIVVYGFPTVPWLLFALLVVLLTRAKRA